MENMEDYCTPEVFNNMAKGRYKSLIERYHENGFLDITQLKDVVYHMCEILEKTEYGEGVKVFMQMINFVKEHGSVSDA